MSELVFNVAKGAVAEKARLTGNLGMMLLQIAEDDETLATRATVDEILAAGNMEANFTDYRRKTGIDGSVRVNDDKNRVDVDIVEQTWDCGAVKNDLVKLIVFHEEGASDSQRVPLTAHDFRVQTIDGADLIARFSANGFFRAI